MYDELILRLRKDAEFLEISSKYNNTVNEFAERISQAADVIEKLSKERKKCKWEWYNCVWVCSCCGKNPTKGMGYVQSKEQLFPFCPYCGADMR